jgi:formylglycine-generating enzyme required for sulfatase activity
VAYQECQNQSPALIDGLEKRLLDFFQREAQTAAFFAPDILASAADSLDHFGYLPADLYTFVKIERPQSAFHIGRYPVTNAQYGRFIQADDFAREEYWVNFPKFSEPDEETGEIKEIGDWGDEGWRWLQSNWDEEEKVFPRFGMARAGVPVVGINWYEANAYCRWLLAHWDELPEAAQNPDWKPALLRLPTEREWIAAAGGDNPVDRYPWDETGEATQDEAEILRRANVSESGIGRTTPVGTYPLGASPHGVWDLGGNVWEWQANYRDNDHDVLALRGGSWGYLHYFARLSVRHVFHPNDRWNLFGFRVAAPPSERI